jgi:4-amino-4-deoxy-L-arabinose transferase-like glycosyltransferase
MSQKPNGHFKAWINAHYSLLSIIIGSALYLFTIGPFYNWDTTLEFQAATGIVQWGKPYYHPNTMINQPPIGFYIAALFFKGFGVGASQQTAVIITTLFGLGCIFLVYKLGETLYGKQVGLLAAALFALTPWQMVMSRSFLIDTQCLFFSLSYLIVGICAIRKDSTKLLMVAGFLFGIALLTKAFAVFMLIPLGLYYACARQKRLRKPTAAAFFLPASLFVFLWYQVLSGLNDILKFILHDDFFNFNELYSPSYFFVGHYLLNTLGIFFLATVTLSITLTCIHRKRFAKMRYFDIICIVTVAVIAGFNTLLAAGFNLKVPYFNPIKYDFQLLPFLCLLAASIVPKFGILFGSLKSKRKRDMLFFMAACVGAMALGIAVYANMSTITLFSTTGYLVFQVEGEVGYSFSNFAQINPSSNIIYIQYVSFALIVSGLLWSGKDQIRAIKRSIPQMIRLF